MMEQCVVRTYGTGYRGDIIDLQDKLKNGWIIKYITPIVSTRIIYVEYILEKD